MPNGGDPEKCARAKLFYEEIRPILESYAERCQLNFIPWYRELPIFVLEWKETDAVTRGIQVNIKPNGEEAVIDIFVHAFSDKQGPRRLKSFMPMRGKLTRDKERILPALRVSMTLLTAIREEDLLSGEEWQKEQAVSTPILCYP